MIEYRRQKVSEMLVEGASQYSIASSLGVSQATISKDVEYLGANAKEQTKRIVEDKLPHAHLQALQGINNIKRLILLCYEALTICASCASYDLLLYLLIAREKVNTVYNFLYYLNNRKHATT
jgi:predicted transcriptional regulator